MILLIDNYDSFTFNLVHYLGGLGAKVAVHRNDKITVARRHRSAPEAIVLSPGPCTPNEAGICLDLIAQAVADDPDFRRLPRPASRSARRSAARSCARRCRCMASCRKSSTMAAASFAASTVRSRRRAIIRWWWSASTMPAALERHRANRRWPGDGRAAQDAAGAWRAVSSRKHRLRTWPSDPEKFSRSCRAMERRCRARRSGRRKFRPHQGA